MDIVVALAFTFIGSSLPSNGNRRQARNARNPAPAPVPNARAGVVQKRSLVRVAKASLAPVIPGTSLEDLKDEDWKRVPHIEEILAYGRERPGFFRYTWKGSYAVLNKMYLDWIHSVPMNSPLYENGQWVPTFVELHWKHFHPYLFSS